MTRTLRLAKETLTALSADELSAVAGGQQDVPTIYRCPLTGPYISIPVTNCIPVTHRA